MSIGTEQSEGPMDTVASNIEVVRSAWRELIKNQNSERINQDSSQRWNKTPEQQKSNTWTPEGSTKDRSSGPSQLHWKLYAGAIIKSEARPTEFECIGNRLLPFHLRWITSETQPSLKAMMYCSGNY